MNDYELELRADAERLDYEEDCKTVSIKEAFSKLQKTLESVEPGKPERFTEAATVGDAIRQGDMIIAIASGPVPGTYKMDNRRKQLVLGNTRGARHCLKDKTANVYIPRDWSEESLDGPYLVCLEETTIVHPVHGDVTIPKDFMARITYQRNLDAITKQERRARD